MLAPPPLGAGVGGVGADNHPRSGARANPTGAQHEPSESEASGGARGRASRSAAPNRPTAQPNKIKGSVLLGWVS